MDDKAIYALKIMANQVTQEQNCVMELIIGEEGMLAHLIPLDLWEAEMEDDEDD